MIFTPADPIIGSCEQQNIKKQEQADMKISNDDFCIVNMNINRCSPCNDCSNQDDDH